MTYIPPTADELLAWGDEVRTCRDCGRLDHVDGGVAADPRVDPRAWLCEDCAGGYRPCDTCDRAIPRGERCDDCAADAASDDHHYRATAAWHDRVR